MLLPRMPCLLNAARGLHPCHAAMPSHQWYRLGSKEAGEAAGLQQGRCCYGIKGRKLVPRYPTNKHPQTIAMLKLAAHNPNPTSWLCMWSGHTPIPGITLPQGLQKKKIRILGETFEFLKKEEHPVLFGVFLPNDPLLKIKWPFGIRVSTVCLYPP